ncbi:MAG: TraB/GumN family protein [Saprospiraceae bacterium]|nr:TraB/GumN family protein [Saprospiraceae bacterium]
MKKKNNSLLWKISGKKNPGDSYVFGTMHVSDERAFTFESLVHEKIRECNAFALEFNLETANINITAEMMNLPGGLTLESMIRPKKFIKINKRFNRLTGYDLRQFNHSLPMQVTNMMAEVVLSKDRLKSLDESLFQFAKDEKKILLGIETFEEQLAIMAKIPVENQLKSLLKTFKSFKQFRRQVLKMAELYEKADIQQLYKSSKKSIGSERKLLLYDRNKIMADRIAIMASKQTIVCAIGAAHLSGKKGVLRYLKKKGLKVKSV